jgi:hypothetical protein
MGNLRVFLGVRDNVQRKLILSLASKSWGGLEGGLRFGIYDRRKDKCCELDLRREGDSRTLLTDKPASNV